MQIKTSILALPLFLALFLASLAPTAWAQDTITAVVTDDILPIMEAPGIRYTINDGELDWVEELNGAVVYGNIITLRPSKNNNWGELISSETGNSLGFIPTKGIFELPTYEKTPPTYFVVSKDNPQLFIEPSGQIQQKSLAKYRLLKGEVVSSVGRMGQMLLLEFDTISKESGIGARYAWGKEEDFIASTSYEPNIGILDESWLPKDVRCLFIPLQEISECPIVEVPDKTLSAISAHGFYINPEPIILDHITADDMGDSYRNLADNTPIFISTDIYYHFFHILFNNLLENLELTSLAPNLEGNLFTAIFQLQMLEDGIPLSLNKPYQKALDMFSIPLALIVEDPSSVTLSPMAAEELNLIMKAQDNKPSQLLGINVDYTLYKPRGHYTDSPILTRYFRSMNFVGSAELTLFKLDKSPNIENIQTAAFISMVLDSLGEKWLSIEEPINYLIGASNTGDPQKFRQLVRTHIGSITDPQSLINLADESVVRALADSIKREIEGPMIQSLLFQDKPGDDFEDRDPVFRISGKRFNVDAFVFNQLTSPRVGSMDTAERRIPAGTDVMAALGSKEALMLSEVNFATLNYKENLDRLMVLAPELLNKDDTVYSKWLSAFLVHFTPSGAGHFFYQDPAWAYKKLLTTLGSFAEIKHDTILYVEQSAAELGEGPMVAGDYTPPYPRGFVEPDPKVFDALLTATDSLLTFIEKYDLETPKRIVSAASKEDDDYSMEMPTIAFSERLKMFAESLSKAKSIAQKEVDGGILTLEDYQNIQSLSSDFGSLLALGGWNDLYSEDLRMALIADCAASATDALEVGTGTPRAIYVYVNDKWGGSRITTGFVYSYYEFTVPLSSGRLTDEEWQAIVYDRSRQSELESYRPSWYANLIF